MGKVLAVRGLRIGVGRPKIIVPLIDAAAADIISRARGLAERDIDIVEWRADFFADVYDTESVLHTLAALREALPDKPLLFTFRTKQEGGEQDILPEDYAALNLAVAQSGYADLMDLEVFSQVQAARQIIAGVQAAGALAVGSYHNFLATPPAAEILARLCQIRVLGADIAKIAVMPAGPADVLTLLNATVDAYEQLDCPVISISMSAQGLLSRIAGGLCGSAATFGFVGQASAPGQIPAEDLARMLDMLQRAT